MQLHEYGYTAAMKPDEGQAPRIWIDLLQAGRHLQDEIEHRLKAAGLPPLAWYDVLIELERGPADGLRPRDLQERLLLAQYNLSRLIDRLVHEELVVRRPCPEDGRGQLVRITPGGRRLRQRMWATYGPAIDELIGQRLPAGLQKVMLQGLGRLRSSAG